MTFNYIHWNIDPEITTIFDFPIRYYGTLFMIGILLGVQVLTSIFKKEGIAKERLEQLTLYGILGIVIGARVGHCLFYEPDYYLNHPLEILLPIRFIDGGGIKFIGFQGLASHGGALGLILALLIYCYKTKASFLGIADKIAIVGPLTGGFIRLANLMNSEIIGTPTNQPWAFVFERIDNIPRHPAQLYEALIYFIIFFIVINIYQSKKYQNGFFVGLVLVLVFTSRFFIEFIKERQVAFEEQMTLDMGQWLSLPYIIAGLILIIYSMRQQNHYFIEDEYNSTNE